MEVIQLSKTKLLSCLNELESRDCKILLYLACKADENDIVTIPTTKMLKELGMKKGTLLSSIKNLKNLKLVDTHLVTASGPSYRIVVDDEDVKSYIQETLF